ncbi:MAG: GrpB family protein [Christensenellaceae bacterium]|jgi:GrpB-like predicted nucleotidyltransferase (UPF0157 family)
MTLGLKQNTVQLAAHDANWEEIARQTILRLWEIFGSAAEEIVHIGSTSIKGIKAKPIIDIAVAIKDFEAFMPLIPMLEQNGFFYRGWFLYARDIVLNVYATPENSDDKIITHHVHVVKANGADWKHHILFRDYLNAHPSVAKAYEALKVALASTNPYDVGREKYNAGKNEFIAQILRDADRWQEEP